MQIKFKPYFSPTQKQVRMFGDAIAGATIFIASFNLNDPELMRWCAIIGGCGKLLSNFIQVDGIK